MGDTLANMSFAQLVGRDSLDTNPNRFSYPAMSDINITSHGAALYWAVSAVMGVSALGFPAIQVEFQRSNPKVAGLYREIFYVRYIDWVVTTPLLLLDVLLTAGLPWPTILITILVDEIMIIA